MASLTRNSNAELLYLPDCSGLLENGKCRWLSVSICLGLKCTHYKGVGSLGENRLEKAQARLRSLDEKTQEHIARKYYGGSRPWAS